MCWHKWSKWEVYEQMYEHVVLKGEIAGTRFPFSETRQRRKCEKCGKVQDVKV